MSYFPISNLAFVSFHSFTNNSIYSYISFQAPVADQIVKPSAKILCNYEPWLKYDIEIEASLTECLISSFFLEIFWRLKVNNFILNSSSSRYHIGMVSQRYNLNVSNFVKERLFDSFQVLEHSSFEADIPKSKVLSYIYSLTAIREPTHQAIRQYPIPQLTVLSCRNNSAHILLLTDHKCSH